MSRTNTSCPSHTESDSTTPKLYQFQLLLSWPTLYLGLPFECRGLVGVLFGVDDFYGSLCPRVAAPLPLLMLRKSTFDVGRDSGVEALVGAF